MFADQRFAVAGNGLGAARAAGRAVTLLPLSLLPFYATYPPPPPLESNLCNKCVSQVVAAKNEVIAHLMKAPVRPFFITLFQLHSLVLV